MAVFALTSVTSTLNASDITPDTKSVVLALDAAQLDSTDFASAGWTEAIGGLKSGTLAITFNDDLVASAIDSDLWSIFGTVVTFSVKGTSAATGSSNPIYSGSVLITGWTLGGGVGDLAGKTLTFPTSGAVSRAIA